MHEDSLSIVTKKIFPHLEKYHILRNCTYTDYKMEDFSKQMLELVKRKKRTAIITTTTARTAAKTVRTRTTAARNTVSVLTISCLKGRMN